MTPAEHERQRAAVVASLQVDSARLTLHDVYPARRSPDGRNRGETGRNAVETASGAVLAVAVANVYTGRVPHHA